MNNRAQLGLWGAIAGIFLLAILGIRSAANWLAQSTPSDVNNPTVTVDGTQANGSGTTDELVERDGEQAIGTRTEDDIVVDRNSDRINAQTNQETDQGTAQPNNILTFSPLEEAGTYIQRQKRVERDSFVAATEVEAIPIASAAPDTRVTQPAPTTVTDNQPSQAAPSTTEPQVVRGGLW